MPTLEGAQGFVIERLQGLASLLEVHAQPGFDRGILGQGEQDVIGAGSAVASGEVGDEFGVEVVEAGSGEDGGGDWDDLLAPLFAALHRPAGGTRIDCYSDEIRARRDAMLAAEDQEPTTTPTARRS